MMIRCPHNPKLYYLDATTEMRRSAYFVKRTNFLHFDLAFFTFREILQLISVVACNFEFLFKEFKHFICPLQCPRQLAITFLSQLEKTVQLTRVSCFNLSDPPLLCATTSFTAYLAWLFSLSKSMVFSRNMQE